MIIYWHPTQTSTQKVEALVATSCHDEKKTYAHNQPLDAHLSTWFAISWALWQNIPQKVGNWEPTHTSTQRVEAVGVVSCHDEKKNIHTQLASERSVEYGFCYFMSTVTWTSPKKLVIGSLLILQLKELKLAPVAASCHDEKKNIHTQSTFERSLEYMICYFMSTVTWTSPQKLVIGSLLILQLKELKLAPGAASCHDEKKNIRSQSASERSLEYKGLLFHEHRDMNIPPKKVDNWEPTHTSTQRAEAPGAAREKKHTPTIILWTLTRVQGFAISWAPWHEHPKKVGTWEATHVVASLTRVLLVAGRREGSSRWSSVTSTPHFNGRLSSPLCSALLHFVFGSCTYLYAISRRPHPLLSLLVPPQARNKRQAHTLITPVRYPLTTKSAFPSNSIASHCIVWRKCGWTWSSEHCGSAKAPAAVVVVVDSCEVRLSCCCCCKGGSSNQLQVSEWDG